MTEALVYFSRKGVTGLTMLKSVKLLYLADRYHMLRYARPVVGGEYSCLKYGPVPLQSYDVISNAIAGSDDEVASDDKFAEAIEVRRNANFANPLLVARRDPDTSVFSESDIEALDHVVREFGPLKACDIVELTHKHAAWNQTEAEQGIGRSSAIPYERFFADDPEKYRNSLEVAILEQEDRDATEMLLESADRG
ncbi:MAG: Panacea domain-containing protein [Thermoanaerobaculia bacterium]